MPGTWSKLANPKRWSLGTPRDQQPAASHAKASGPVDPKVIGTEDRISTPSSRKERQKQGERKRKQTGSSRPSSSRHSRGPKKSIHPAEAEKRWSSPDSPLRKSGVDVPDPFDMDASAATPAHRTIASSENYVDALDLEEPPSSPEMTLPELLVRTLDPRDDDLSSSASSGKGSHHRAAFDDFDDISPAGLEEEEEDAAAAKLAAGPREVEKQKVAGHRLTLDTPIEKRPQSPAEPAERRPGSDMLRTSAAAVAAVAAVAGAPPQAHRSGDGGDGGDDHNHNHDDSREPKQSLASGASLASPAPAVSKKDAVPASGTSGDDPPSNAMDIIAEPLLDDSHTDPTSTPRPQTAQSIAQASDHGDPLVHSGDDGDDDDDSAPAPPDFTRRGIHIPTRTSSKPMKFKDRVRSLHRDSPRASLKNTSRQHSTDALVDLPREQPRNTFTKAAARAPPAEMAKDSTDLSSSDTHDHASTADSVISYESSMSSLPPLQSKGPSEPMSRLEPVLEDDPNRFDLLPSPGFEEKGLSYNLEDRADLLFSSQHLQAIFADSALLLRFTSFLSATRPKSVPVLIYYLDALKALRAINYANAVAEALEPIIDHDFTDHPARPTINSVLEEKANHAFEVLVREDLPAYVAHVFIQVVSVSIQRRITGTLPPHLREASEGLAEVFCLTDPSRPDNPIIFASEEFHRTTQYGVNYAIGRNCRFLQGPKTGTDSVRRLREAISAGKEISELFLNYRRDGSPFMNLLMMAPLYDSRGVLRYFIGAQVDVSGLVRDCTDLEGLQRVIAKQEGDLHGEEDLGQEQDKDEFQELAEMFNINELDSVRRFGGRMHRQHAEEPEDLESALHRPRIVLRDHSGEKIRRSLSPLGERPNGKLDGVYQHYLLVRPAPSLRILFTSPSLRVPGLLQTPFLDRISGSPRVKESLATALAEGRGVTARIRWIPNPRFEDEGRSRWIHCTPLLGANGRVGVWMVVLVEDSENGVGDVRAAAMGKRFRAAPPVARTVSELRRQKQSHPHPWAQQDAQTNNAVTTQQQEASGKRQTHGASAGHLSHHNSSEPQAEPTFIDAGAPSSRHASLEANHDYDIFKAESLAREQESQQQLHRQTVAASSSSNNNVNIITISSPSKSPTQRTTPRHKPIEINMPASPSVDANANTTGANAKNTARLAQLPHQPSYSSTGNGGGGSRPITPLGSPRLVSNYSAASGNAGIRPTSGMTTGTVRRIGTPGAGSVNSFAL